MSAVLDKRGFGLASSSFYMLCHHINVCISAVRSHLYLTI